MSENLRKAITKLAKENPELRTHLIPLLKTAKKKKSSNLMSEWISGPEIQKAIEKTCNCKVDHFSLGRISVGRNRYETTISSAVDIKTDKEEKITGTLVTVVYASGVLKIFSYFEQG